MSKLISAAVLMLFILSSCASAPKAGDYYRKGSIKYSEKDYTAAIEQYDKAIALSPKNMDAYFARGLAKAKKGNYAGAISDMQAAGTLGHEQAEAEIERIKREAKANPAINPPSGLAAEAIEGGVNLTWDKNRDSNAGEYNIYMSKKSSKEYTCIVRKNRENQLKVSGLKSGVKYYFVVTSIGKNNRDLESVFSIEASAVVK